MKNILNCAGRALSGTETALNALLGIDHTEIVDHCDRTFRAYLRTLAAADAGDRTSFSGICALLLVVAADLDLGRLGKDLDQFLRARLSTCAAACAIVTSYNGNAVDDANRIEFTCSNAVTQTDAAVRTLLAPAEQLLGCFTGVDVLILIKFGGVIRCAVAHNKCNLFLHAAGILSQKGCQLSCYRRTADGALSAGDVAAFCKRMSIIVTSGKSAAAAVGSGELCTQVEEKLIFLDGTYFGRIAEHAGSEETDDDNKYYGYCNIHPLSPFL